MIAPKIKKCNLNKKKFVFNKKTIHCYSICHQVFDFSLNFGSKIQSFPHLNRFPQLSLPRVITLLILRYKMTEDFELLNFTKPPLRAPAL